MRVRRLFQPWVVGLGFMTAAAGAHDEPRASIVEDTSFTAPDGTRVLQKLQERFTRGPVNWDALLAARPSPTGEK